jgi:hypothetical protein
MRSKRKGKYKEVKSRGDLKMKIMVPVRKIKRRKGSMKKEERANKCKLTLRAKNIVYAAIEAGLPISKCAHLIGVDHTTFYTYMKYGEDPRYAKFYEFRRKIKRIEKNRELEALKVIREAASGGFVVKRTKIKTSNRGMTVTKEESTLSPQWQAAAWFLERKDKLNWSREGLGETNKTPGELAEEVQAAQAHLYNSVPTEDGE